MSILNVNKITLEDTNESKIAFANIALLSMSIIYDKVIEGKYEDALRQFDLLIASIENLNYALNKEISKKIGHDEQILLNDKKLEE